MDTNEKKAGLAIAAEKRYIRKVFPLRSRGGLKTCRFTARRASGIVNFRSSTGGVIIPPSQQPRMPTVPLGALVSYKIFSFSNLDNFSTIPTYLATWLEDYKRDIVGEVKKELAWKGLLISLVRLFMLLSGEPDHVFGCIRAAEIKRNYVVNMITWSAIGITSVSHEFPFCLSTSVYAPVAVTGNVLFRHRLAQQKPLRKKD